MPAHLYPFVPLLLELKRRGHRVRFSLLEEGKSLDRIAGISVRSVHLPESATDKNSESYVSASFLRHGAPVAADVSALLTQERPDVLLMDPMLWGGMIAAEASGKVWAVVSHNPQTIRGEGFDLRGPGLPPPKGWSQRLLYRFIQFGLGGIETHLKCINSLRAEYGLRSLAHPWDLCYTAPLTIATTAEPFEYPRSDWPESYQFVGPLIWEPSVKRARLPKQLPGRPMVLVVGSSIPEMGPSKSWVSVALEALAGERYQVIATIPNGDVPVEVPQNAHVERFFPHGPLLRRAACVICHGGSGITHKALAAGVPVVAVPFAYDRFEVARRVEIANAGVMLRGKHLTRDRLRDAVRDAIGCRSGAERVAAAFREAGGAPAAVDSIERLIDRAN